MTNTPNILILADLDDSLFSTRKKIPLSQQGDMTLAARASAGAAAGKDSFMTRKQVAMLEWMDLSRCVPVTARGTDAYSRVTLPFAGPAAILCNGAVMLNGDGSVNEPWAVSVNEVLGDLQEVIHQLVGTLKTLAEKRSMNIRSWAVVEPSCGAVYAVAKCNDSPTGEGLEMLVEELKTHLHADEASDVGAWTFHTNGNNLSVTPRGISKAIAVSHLLKTIQTDSQFFTVGVGDSATDLEFMRLCDMWMTPGRSQIDLLLGKP